MKLQRAENATYACINYGEAVCPEQIKGWSICIDNDIRTIISEME